MASQESTRRSASAGWQAAVAFAARAHLGQFRKDGRTPYVSHPLRVALTVRHVFEIDDPIALTTALLHDVLEDTTTDYDDLCEEFGADVADAVAALTKDPRLPEARREAEYDMAVAAASWQARAVKLADVYDNFCDAQSDAKRDSVRKKAERAIRCAGDEPRLQRAVEIVRQLTAS